MVDAGRWRYMAGSSNAEDKLPQGGEVCCSRVLRMMRVLE